MKGNWATGRHNVNGKNRGVFEPQPAWSLEGRCGKVGVRPAGEDISLGVMRHGTPEAGRANPWVKSPYSVPALSSGPLHGSADPAESVSQRQLFL